MEAWWDSLGPVIRVFYVIGFVSSVAVIVQLALTLIGVGDTDADAGFDFDADADVDVDGAHHHHGDSGLSLLSVRGITGFLFGFGWMGALALKSGFALITSMLVALAVGFVFLYLIYLLLRALHGLRESGNLDYRNAIGETGTVYIPIPAGRSGAGQIEVTFQSRHQVIAAVTSHPAAIPAGAQVFITGADDTGVLEVQPVTAIDTPALP